MPLEQILTMYGYGTRVVPSRLPSFGEGILGSEDLTLDKDEIARDLLQHTDHDRETSVHDLLNSVDIGASSQTIRLLRGSHVTLDSSFCTIYAYTHIYIHTRPIF
jgi:hypothetical protein